MITATILTEDEDVFTEIQIKETSPHTFNFYLAKRDVGSNWDTHEGTIFNHEGDYLELLEKILHGRNMS